MGNYLLGNLFDFLILCRQGGEVRDARVRQLASADARQRRGVPRYAPSHVREQWAEAGEPETPSLRGGLKVEKMLDGQTDAPFRLLIEEET